MFCSVASSSVFFFRLICMLIFVFTFAFLIFVFIYIFYNYFIYIFYCYVFIIYVCFIDIRIGSYKLLYDVVKIFFLVTVDVLHIVVFLEVFMIYILYWHVIVIVVVIIVIAVIFTIIFIISEYSKMVIMKNILFHIVSRSLFFLLCCNV